MHCLDYRWLSAVLVSFFLLSGCSSQPCAVMPEPKDDPSVFAGHWIHVANHGWHTGIVIPAQQMNQALPELVERFGDGMWYEMGWGDKGFYQAQEITAALTLRAMFWSSGAVMHVVSIPIPVEHYFPDSEIISVQLTDAELTSLVTFIVQSFESDKDSRLITRKEGLYGDSQFYAAKGRFSVLNTCNKWTAKGLKSAGMDITAMFKLTSGSVMDYLKEKRAECGHVVRIACPPAAGPEGL